MKLRKSTLCLCLTMIFTLHPVGWMSAHAQDKKTTIERARAVCGKECVCLTKAAQDQCVEDAKQLGSQVPPYRAVAEAGKQAAVQARENEGAKKQAVRDRNAERKISDARLVENTKLKTEVVWWQRATVVGVVVGVVVGAAGAWVVFSNVR